MIQLENINFSYNKRKNVFEDLSLRIGSGHVYGLLGKNGVGKTTLLRLISGLNFAQSGQIRTLDLNPAYRPAELLKRIYLLQEEPFAPRISISNFVKSNAPFYEYFNQNQFDEYLHLFEIDSQEMRMDRMSLGQKKKVHISFALAANTDILLMDEPTNGLDIPSKTQFRKMLSMATSDDRLILISTHQVRDLQNLIDALVIVDEGRILLNATESEITDKLCFRISSETETDEPLLFFEENIRGNIMVTENIHHLDSKMDIELLFNTAMLNKKRISELFNTK